MKTLRGIAAAGGVAVGPVFQFSQPALRFERSVVRDPAAEWRRFEAASDAARGQVEAICAQAPAGSEQAAIFQAHALMLQDPELLLAVRSAIEEKHLNAEAALSDAAETYAQMLDSFADEYLRARAADVRDVKARLLRILLGATESGASGPKVPSIILARDLTPSETVLLDRALVLGFCTADGGPTSHVAILARSMGQPAVVGAGADVLEIVPGTPAILDGNEGLLHVHPDPGLTAAYISQQAAAATIQAEARKRSHQVACTTDGHRMEVLANVGNEEEARAALEAGAEGVGLLRTEFLYMQGAALPSEDEQYRAYRAIIDIFRQQPVILRTLDIGGDKALPYLDLPHEMNPSLGLRGIRLCLKRPELLRPQLRAALRAGDGRNLKLMFPMVATVDEIRAARKLLEECRAELLAERRPIPQRTEVGIMVEIPAAALLADHLAAEVDFFSIGTNDLSQYTMAADRTNAQVASLAAGLQPAVLRLVRDVIIAAHRHGRQVGLCGELAGELAAIPILLGLGLDELSMSPAAIPLAKQIIRALSTGQAQDLASTALEVDSPEDVVRLSWERAPETRKLGGLAAVQA